MENKISEARREYSDRVGKFTQKDAADFFGVSLSTYKKWEQGKGMMNGEQLRMIAMKYDTTVDYLLEITPHIENDISEQYILNDNEKELIDNYRMLSIGGKNILKGVLDGLLLTHPKNNQLRENKTA